MEQPDPDLQARLSRISLVLMDIDGTLVSSDRTSFENVLVQLRKLKPLNIRFSVATGRTVSGSAGVLERLRDVRMRMPPVINYNGGVVLSGQDFGVLTRHMISQPLFQAAVALCRGRGLAPIAYACSSRLAEVPVERVYAEIGAVPAAEFNGMVFEQVQDLSAVEDDFVALMIETGTSDAAVGLAAELAAEFGDGLRISTSGGRYVEISHPHGTKRQAMEALSLHYRVSLDAIMAIGDNLNDLEMIQVAGVGVAVANAPDAVKAEARYVCMRPSAEGVVEAIRLLVSVKRHLPQPGVTPSSWPTTTESTMAVSERPWLTAS